MQDPTVLKQVLEFFKAHQVHPKYDVAFGGVKAISTCLYERQDGCVQLFDLSVDPTDQEAPVRSLQYVTGTYSEYVKNTDVMYGAFNAYLLVSELDALCDFLFVDTFTDAVATAKCNMQVFDIKKWLLDVLVRANTRHIYQDQWNKHCKTLDRIIQCYDKYKTLYVLDMPWSDFKPSQEHPEQP